MKKIFTLTLLACLCSLASGQVQIYLFSEDFDNGPSSFMLNAPGIGTNTGNNQWVINDDFSGVPLYPDTKPQDSVVSGQINANNAPYSNYLHIHDLAAANATNDSVDDACWNPATASDQFCYMGSPFCTLGLTNVTFTFFWLCEGDSNAYGQVYYSVNGGPWTQTGRARYNAQSIWEYESIQEAAFNNVENIQFGFRWVNQGGDTTKDESFAIDDIVAIGNYDNLNHPVNLSITQIFPDTVCENGDLVIEYSLSAPLCDGTYDIKLSDATGSFANPTDEGIFDIEAPETSGYIDIQVPNNITGDCFRIAIIRVAPEPDIESDTSICFAIIDCPVSVFTGSAPVMNDVDTTCVKSAIDVSFNSYGNFNPNNIYYGEFSDTNGSFAHPDTFGHLVSSMAYPVMPGTVSGLVPANLPPGCGYYIRIVSSSPASIGTTIGPFCVKQCDVTTNHTQDINLCVGYPNATDTAILNVMTNSWPDSDTYSPCNNWTVELLSMLNFAVVNIGGLGIYHDSISGNFLLIAGPTLPPGVAAGSYYLRIISNCPNVRWDSTGTVIRITIGEPFPTPSTITSNSPDSVYCNAGVLELQVNPYNFNSQYWWNSNLYNNGNPILNPASNGNTFYGNLAGAPPGEYAFYVREENYGCYGPSSAAYIFDITTLPLVNISGPHQVCLGDTSVFHLSFLPGTYYDWSAPPGVQVLVEGNNEVSMIFDTVGSFTIKDVSVNICGTESGTYAVKVVTVYSVNAGPNQVICQGQSDSLTAVSNSANKVFTSQDTAHQGMQGGMFNIIAHDDVTIDSFAVMYRIRHAATGFIYGKSGSYQNYEETPSAWTSLVSYTNLAASPVGQMTIIPYELNQPMAAGDTEAFYLTTTGATPIVDEAYGQGTGIQQGVVYASDGVIDFVQGTVNNYPFGTYVGPRILNVNIYYSTKAGLKYIWSNGDTTAAIQVAPAQTTTYSVVVYDTSGCRAQDTVLVSVNPAPAVYAGPDTAVCPNVNYIMPATSASQKVNWSPAGGLTSTDTLNPTFNSDSSQVYVLTATGPNGCTRSDSVKIRIIGLYVNPGPDTTICDGTSDMLNASSSTTNVVWSIPPGGSLSDTTILNPVFTYTQAAAYPLVITASDSSCTLSKMITITVQDCNSYIKAPQAFTPNGDGTNDFFTVFGAYIADYQIKIYNRWGEEVYFSTDVTELNDLSRGWNGTYKGKKQDTGTYVYYISAKSISGKSIFEKGNFELIR